MNNILITGVTGFIGAHLADYLSQNKSNNIYGVFRSIRDESTYNALKLNDKKNVNLVLGNVNVMTDIEDIIVQYDINKIYHLASKVIVRDAAMYPTVTYITNVIGTLSVLECVKNAKINYDKDISTLIMSSDKAYGVSDKLPYTEDLTLNGLDIYSSSKAMADILSRAYAYNYDLPIVVARPCNCYGEFDFNWSRLVPTLAKTCLQSVNETEKRQLTLNKGSYEYKREYIYVKDMTNALKSLLDNIDKTKGKAYNISSGYVHTTEEIVKTFLGYMDINLRDKIDIVFKEKKLIFKEIPKQYLDGTKMYNDTGWKVKHNINDGLSKTFDGYIKWFDYMDEYYEELEKITNNINNTINK